MCRSCFNQLELQVAQARGARAGVLDPAGTELVFARPRTLLLVGLGLIFAAIGLGALEVIFVGRVHLILLGILLATGIGALGRGIMR